MMKRRDFIRSAAGIFIPVLAGAQSLSFPGPGSPAAIGVTTFSALTHVSAGCGPGSPDGITTASIDTTGANLIVVVASWYPFGGSTNVAISDNKSNGSPTALTAFGAGNAKGRIFYWSVPTVGTGHTFTVAGTASYSSIAVMAFSGAAISGVFDVENGTDGNAITTLTTPSITPTVNNELIISALCVDGGGSTYTNTSTGMTVVETLNYVLGRSQGLGLAYKIQTTAAPISPVWDWTSSASAVSVASASFKA